MFQKTVLFFKETVAFYFGAGMIVGASQAVSGSLYLLILVQL